MDHFIDWKFGVPVKIYGKYSNPAEREVLLISETKITFSAIAPSGALHQYPKCNFYYELIPYKLATNGIRYPICENSKEWAYCNREDEMGVFGNTPHKDNLVRRKSPVTINIDGKTVTLSDERVAELKKKLGV